MVGHVQLCEQDDATTCVFNRADVVIAYGGSPSLIQGWVPLSVEIVAALALGYVLVWRRRRRGRVEIGAGLIVGLATVLAARWALQDSGISGEVAPGPLWGWTAATGFAVTIAVSGWRGATGWWRNGAVLASSLCLLSTGLVINGWIGYLPTVTVAWDQLSGRPLPHQIDWSAAVAMRSRGDRPHDGQLVAVDTGDRASGFSHRTEWVYLPPSWFRGTGATESAVMMIGGEFTTSVDWVRAGQAAVTADSYAHAHDGNAPILVFVDANGAFTNDTECVNGIRGRAADHLTDDVVPDIIRHFGVSADPRHWSVAGFSSGGTCAVDLAVMHPERFASFVDIAGDERPQAGTQAQTIQRLFGGDRQAWERFDPASVITRHGRYADTAGLFVVPESAHSDADAARRLCRIGAAQGVRCSITALPGRHTWPFAAAAFERALPWLAASHDAAARSPGDSR
jgi:S-formylglutathione hydrolase FrmB